jgi:hypothetical protein
MFPYASASTRLRARSRRAALWLAFRTQVKKRLAASLGV